MRRGIVVSIVAALALAACGGGSNGVAPVASQAPKSANGKATLTLTIPRATSQGRQYVSSGMQSVSIAQGGTNLGTFNTTATSPGCTQTQSGLQCSFSIAPAVGVNQVFTVTAYQFANGQGAVLSSGTTTATIVANANTNIPVTMNGQVAVLAVTIPSPVPAAAATSAPVLVQAKDATGATIVGPGSYTTAITLSDGDSSGITKLAVNGGTAATSVQINAPSDSVVVQYNGSNLTAATLTASTAVNSGTVSAVGFFEPVPVVVNTFIQSFPSTYGVYAYPVDTDPMTHSFWFVVNTPGGFGLEQMSANGGTNLRAVNQIGTSPYSFVTHGPQSKLWLSQSYGAGIVSYDPVNNIASVLNDASGLPCTYYNLMLGNPSGAPAFYGSGLSCSDDNLPTTLPIDTHGNFLGRTAINSINNAVGVGSNEFYPSSSQILGELSYAHGTMINQFTGFGQVTLNSPVAASDGTLWDSLNCSISHITPNVQFSSTTAAYYTVPSALCTALNMSFNGRPILTSDGGVWAVSNGALTGIPSSATPVNAVYSTVAIPLVTNGGSTVPFAPQAWDVAADGNLIFLVAVSSGTYMIVEVGY